MCHMCGIAFACERPLDTSAFISWTAVLFYLALLLCHHTEQVGQSCQTHVLFKFMEFKLATVIMRPAMIGTWIFGLALVFTPGIVDWAAVWPWTKGASVFAMTGFHGWLVGRVNAFAAGENRLSGKRYRIMNEVPTLLMIIIVFSVVVKF